MKASKWCQLTAVALLCVASSAFAEKQGEPVARPEAMSSPTKTEFKQPLDVLDYGAGKTYNGSDCGACCDQGGCRKCNTFLIGGSEATFLWPDFHRSSNNYTYVNALGVPPTATFASDATSIDHNLLIGPRVWLGVQGCKWGMIGRYWNLADTASSVSPPVPGYGVTQLGATDSFRAYYADLEATRSFCLGGWSTTGSFGVRYAALDLNNTLSSSVFSVLGEYAGASSSSRLGFDGTGLTMGLWGSKQIHPCSCWNWFFSGRASILWGNSSSYAMTQATTSDILGAATSVDAAYAKGGGDLFIGELQYGIQWERQLKCIPSRAFFRIAGEYQYWDASNATRAGAFSGAVTPISTAFAVAESNSVLFDLVGFTIGAGLTY
jgi:hypothetical protein